MSDKPPAQQNELRQCCTCNYWLPMAGQGEIGKCMVEKNKSEAMTLYSDGCNRWLSNKDEQK